MKKLLFLLALPLVVLIPRDEIHPVLEDSFVKTGTEPRLYHVNYTYNQNKCKICNKGVLVEQPDGTVKCTHCGTL
jgi:hypothetical protein